MIQQKIEWIPVVNEKKEVMRILFWDDLFRKEEIKHNRILKIPIVIMAGGSGKRMKPFTDILPKPLIPIKGKPVIEIIMENFHQYGTKEFYVSINYKSRIIKAYFEESNVPFKIHYITEQTPLGTAGGLRFLLNKIRGDFIVTNCDTIINADYYDMVAFHRKNKLDITIVGSLKNYIIPYGICETDNQGLLKNIREKPEYDFLINTGMYILNHSVLRFIQAGKIFHMPNLIRTVQSHNGSIGVFPISEKSWIDIGQWEEYKKTLRNFEEF